MKKFLFQPNNMFEDDIIILGKVKLDQHLIFKRNFNKERSGKSNFLDLFFLWKKYLNIYNIETKVDPVSNIPSYTTKEFDTYDVKFMYVTSFKTNQEEGIKILHVKDSKNANFVLKRNWIPIKENNLNEEDIFNFETFLMNKYREYALVKLYNACPYSAKPNGFHFIYITNQKILVSEMVTIFAGNTLYKAFPEIGRASCRERV